MVMVIKMAFEPFLFVFCTLLYRSHPYGGFNHSLYSYIQIFVGNLDLATEVSIGRVMDKRQMIDNWLIDSWERQMKDD